MRAVTATYTLVMGVFLIALGVYVLNTGVTLTCSTYMVKGNASAITIPSGSVLKVECPSANQGCGVLLTRGNFTTKLRGGDALRISEGGRFSVSCFGQCYLEACVPSTSTQLLRMGVSGAGLLTLVSAIILFKELTSMEGFKEELRFENIKCWSKSFTKHVCRVKSSEEGGLRKTFTSTVKHLQGKGFFLVKEGETYALLKGRLGSRLRGKVEALITLSNGFVEVEFSIPALSAEGARDLKKIAELLRNSAP